MRIILITLLITVSLLLTGCKKVFSIFVSQTPDGIVAFRFEPRDNAVNEGANITRLQVYRENPPDQKSEMVWSIRTESGNPQKVYSITYGVVPPGFKEFKPAQPLILGELYDVMSAMPNITGGADFTYGNISKRGVSP